MRRGATGWLGFVLCLTLSSASFSPAATWKEEFDRLCGQTAVATSLSTEQLRVLVADSDALLVRLDEVKDPAKKVYILRLQKCRSFFAYMVGLREQGDAGARRP